MLTRQTHEFLRPCKLATLAAGFGLLIAGRLYYNALDWDAPVSVIMAVVAYLTAPWCVRVLLERRLRALPVVLLLTWFAVDGRYAMYWRLVDSGGLVGP
jgi:hypothetical protein